MASDAAQQIKEKLDIVTFLKGYLELAPAGKNFKARCPFHSERTASFMVSPDRGTWHCFGACNTGGDIFTFLMRYENIEFFEALKILAEKAGVVLEHANSPEERQFGVLYDINLAAKIFFVEELTKAAPIKEYIRTRGLKEATAAEFELGYAPQAKADALTLFLIKKGYKVQDIERSGLTIRSDRGGYFDRFRGRVMFPILNHFGKTVGFTGRILPEFDNGATGKYVNSPETAIFKKSKLIYGFFKTKNAVREKNTAFLVEGQMDFLLAYQDGVKNVVATSGTALTAEHLTVLRKHAEKVILSFDADEAGESATERAIDLAIGFDFDVRIFLLPKDIKDPAEFVEKHPGRLMAAAEQAVSARTFYFAKYLKEGPEKKSIRALLGKAKRLPSSVERSDWVHALARETDLREQDLFAEMDALAVQQVAPVAEQSASPSASTEQIGEKRATRWELIAENLISAALATKNFDLVRESEAMLPPRYREAVPYLEMNTNAPTPELQTLVNAMALKSGLGLAYSTTDLVRELKREHLKGQQEGILTAIRRAERLGDEIALRKLMQEFDVLSRELHT
jgi:DNA primase catalytic core